MGDVDDGHTVGGQVTDDPEQVGDTTLVEHRRRLVQDQQPGLVGQGPRHADDLLRRRCEAADRPAGRDVGMAEPAQQLPGPPVGGGRAAEARRGELVAEEDVLRDGEVGHQVEFLVDRGDAQLDRGDRVGDGHIDAVPTDAALVRLVGAGHDLDQGGLAGAVLAEQAVHLAGANVQVHPVQGDDSGKPFDHAAHLQQRLAAVSGRHDHEPPDVDVRIQTGEAGSTQTSEVFRREVRVRPDDVDPEPHPRSIGDCVPVWCRTR